MAERTILRAKSPLINNTRWSRAFRMFSYSARLILRRSVRLVEVFHSLAAYVYTRVTLGKYAAPKLAHIGNSIAEVRALGADSSLRACTSTALTTNHPYTMRAFYGPPPLMAGRPHGSYLLQIPNILADPPGMTTG